MLPGRVGVREEDCCPPRSVRCGWAQQTRALQTRWHEGRKSSPSGPLPPPTDHLPPVVDGHDRHRAAGNAVGRGHHVLTSEEETNPWSQHSVAQCGTVWNSVAMHSGKDDMQKVRSAPKHPWARSEASSPLQG
eukprot:363091-Chlamydomonas_euryale.AAC.1